MEKSFVIVATELIKEPDVEPGFRYRAYVNEELFTERTWIWDNRFYLEENMQIEAGPGEYRIRFEFLGTGPESVKVKNIRVVEGPGRIVKNKLVLDEE